MKFIYHFVVLLIYLTSSNSTLQNNEKDDAFANFKDPNVINKHILRTGVEFAEDNVQYDEEEINKKILREGAKIYGDNYKYEQPRAKKKKKAVYFFKNQNENKIDDKNSQTDLEVDLEEYRDETLTIPSREAQHNDEENIQPKKKKIKKNRFIPKTNILRQQPPEYKKVQVQKAPKLKFVNEKKEKEDTNEDEIVNYNKLQHLEDMKDAKTAKEKAKIMKNAKKYEKKLNNFNFPKTYENEIGKERYHMDPVLNVLRSHIGKRRKGSSSSGDLSSSSSSSRELKKWKDEFKEHWEHKRWEALNQSALHFGDEINMAAARPWGVPCGDPNQHDMPWGTCMLAVECESEYRIYRGDYFCGRTQYVCCALQMTNYDLYQGIDASFDEKSLSTDSRELKSSNEDKKKKSKKRKRKRRKEREKRKKRIKKNIKKIVREIKKILDRHYRNGTKQRKRKTKQLKKFVTHMKKQYKKERQAITNIHEEELIKIDIKVMTRLQQIKEVNHNFMKNSTFRDIIVNGTATKQGARMLVEAYPELQSYFNLRRSGSGLKAPSKDYLEYDVEYGYLYY